jgi:hypothetical protein
MAELREVVGFLAEDIVPWTEGYWDADPAAADSSIIHRYHNDKSREESPPVPMATTPAGYDLGFVDAQAPLDVGPRMLLLQNTARSCYWVHISFPGLWNDIGVADIARFAERSMKFAIHVAILFHKDRECAINSQGFEGLRVSLGAASEDEDLILQSLWDLSESVNEMTRAIMLRRKSSHESRPQAKLTAETVMRELFYRAPWRVMVWPTQPWARGDPHSGG